MISDKPSPQHTPGPWEADKEVIGWWSGEQTGCMVRFFRGSRGMPIANCLRGETGYVAAVANAKLMAAAPELAEALKSCLGSMQMELPECEGCTTDPCTQCRAKSALKKAGYL
jgi:hypothetical protein